MRKFWIKKEHLCDHAVDGVRCSKAGLSYNHFAGRLPNYSMNNARGFFARRSYKIKRLYQRAFRNGQEVGYNQGYLAGFEEGYEKGYREGINLGYNNGFLSALEDKESGQSNYRADEIDEENKDSKK